MKNFFDCVIKILINTVIIVCLVAFGIILFIFLVSQMNNTSIVDTLSYFKSFNNQTTILTGDTIDTINTSFSSDNKVNTTNSSINYYYEQLDENAKIIYDALNNNIDNLKKSNYTIDFSNKFNLLLNQTDGQYKLDFAFQSALDAFFYDHTELFYIDLAKMNLIVKSTTIGPKVTYTVSLSPSKNNNYLNDNFNSETQVIEAISKVESIKYSTTKALNGKSDYEKALYVHDALVNSLKYDSSINSHNIYGALVEKTAVCEGYAKAFKYILDDLNIECILVSGTATNSSGKTESHMWNYIKLDGKWYGVDVTWDDPIVVGNIKNSIIRHDYFCKGSNIFNDSHVTSNKISNEGKFFRLPTLSIKDYK